MLIDSKVILVVISTLIAFYHVDSSNVLTVSSESDDENTLRQALYLVKLLKSEILNSISESEYWWCFDPVGDLKPRVLRPISGRLLKLGVHLSLSTLPSCAHLANYIKSLRENTEVETNFTDEANSTCPEEPGNSTTPIFNNITGSVSPSTISQAPVTLSSVSVPTLTSPPVIPTPMVPPVQSYSVQPLALPALPVAALPTISNAPPPGFIQTAPPGNILPAENYKYPYRMYQRRMIPDYYYYDVPIPRFGSYRRVGYVDPMGAVPAVQQGNYRRYAAFLPKHQAFDPKRKRGYYPTGRYRRQEYYARTNEPYIQAGYRRAGNAAPLIDAPFEITVAPTLTIESNLSEGNKTTFDKGANSSQVQQTSSFVLVSRAAEATPSSVTTQQTLSSTPVTKSLRTRGVSKATKANSKFNIKGKKANIFRQRITTEKPTSEDFLLSQVASELLNEFRGTNTKNIPALFKNSINNNILRQKHFPQKSTIKLYLPGSSRIPIPFPENNAFCHLYPQSKLCGSGI